MNSAPQWWYVVSGLFFGLGLVFYVVLIALLLMLLSMLKKLMGQIKDLMKKIDGITVKVDGLVSEVRGVTEKVGAQATGAAGNINAFTAGIAQKAEIASLIFLVIGAIRGFMAGKKAPAKARKILPPTRK